MVKIQELHMLASQKYLVIKPLLEFDNISINQNMAFVNLVSLNYKTFKIKSLGIINIL